MLSKETLEQFGVCWEGLRIRAVAMRRCMTFRNFC